MKQDNQNKKAVADAVAFEKNQEAVAAIKFNSAFNNIALSEAEAAAVEAAKTSKIAQAEAHEKERLHLEQKEKLAYQAKLREMKKNTVTHPDNNTEKKKK
jgi:hypothetical protein